MVCNGLQEMVCGRLLCPQSGGWRWSVVGARSVTASRPLLLVPAGLPANPGGTPRLQTIDRPPPMESQGSAALGARNTTALQSVICGSAAAASMDTGDRLRKYDSSECEIVERDCHIYLGPLALQDPASNC